MTADFTIYQVQKGNCLWNIAKKEYNLTDNAEILKKVKEIVEINNIKNPDLIFPEQTLKLANTQKGTTVEKTTVTENVSKTDTLKLTTPTVNTAKADASKAAISNVIAPKKIQKVTTPVTTPVAKPTPTDTLKIGPKVEAPKTHVVPDSLDENTDFGKDYKEVFSDSEYTNKKVIGETKSGLTAIKFDCNEHKSIYSYDAQGKVIRRACYLKDGSFDLYVYDGKFAGNRYGMNKNRQLTNMDDAKTDESIDFSSVPKAEEKSPLDPTDESTPYGRINTTGFLSKSEAVNKKIFFDPKKKLTGVLYNNPDESGFFSNVKRRQVTFNTDGYITSQIIFYKNGHVQEQFLGNGCDEFISDKNGRMIKVHDFKKHVTRRYDKKGRLHIYPDEKVSKK